MKNFLIALLILVLIASTASSVDLWIHYSGNLRGMLDPCGCKIPAGGIAQRIGEIDQYRSIAKNDLHIYVDAGEWMDLFDPVDGDKKTLCLLKAMTYGPLVAVNVSARDFLRECALLDTLKKMSQIPFISANLRDTLQRQVFPPFHAVDTVVNGKKMKFAFIGLTDPINNRTMVKRNGLIAMDWTLILKDVRNELNEKGYETIILLTDAQTARLDTLLQNEKPFSLIITTSQSWKAGVIHSRPYGPVVAPEMQGKNWHAVKSNQQTENQWELFSRPLINPVTMHPEVVKLLESCKKEFSIPLAPNALPSATTGKKE